MNEEINISSVSTEFYLISTQPFCLFLLSDNLTFFSNYSKFSVPINSFILALQPKLTGKNTSTSCIYF